MSELRYSTAMQVYKSWEAIKGTDHVRTAMVVYTRLFELEPNANALFGFGGTDGTSITAAANPVFAAHVRALFDTLDLIVNSLGPDLEPLAQELVELGRRHRLRGVPASYLPLMARAFLDATGQLLLSKNDPEEDKKAWREIFEFVISHMTAGMANAST
jgi:hypothetical protein